MNSPVQASSCKEYPEAAGLFGGESGTIVTVRNRAGQRLLRDAERKAEPEKPGETKGEEEICI